MGGIEQKKSAKEYLEGLVKEHAIRLSLRGGADDSWDMLIEELARQGLIREDALESAKYTNRRW